jgi:hypothetical protein
MAYTAIVLDEESRNKILNDIIIPDGWEEICHHLTIRMGDKLTDADRKMLKDKTPWKMKGVAVGTLEGQVRALRISYVEGGWISENDTPHITLAVNREAGGKPFMSNKIDVWEKLARRIDLVGFLEICD